MRIAQGGLNAGFAVCPFGCPVWQRTLSDQHSMQSLEPSRGAAADRSPMVAHFREQGIPPRRQSDAATQLTPSRVDGIALRLGQSCCVKVREFGVSENETTVQRREELAAKLSAARLEKAEAYLEADWVRVWELTNNEIPALEQEIVDLGQPLAPGTTPANHVAHRKTPPLDFDTLQIDILESRNSILKRFLHRRSAIYRVKVSLGFSDEQRKIAEAQLTKHIVFYECRHSRPVTVANLLKGSWVSGSMRGDQAQFTAENARDGINDLRLIMQERAMPRES